MVRVGNYKVTKEIGKGGFGRVFEAEHVLLGEKACLKQNLQADPEHVELLRYESKLLWKLNEYHSIPSIKDFHIVNPETGVIVMDYIEGKTLWDLVEDKGPLHPEDASWITERLLGALYYSHCNGVIHTDVKPQNVFVEPAKRDIKLIDFGLATYKPKSSTRPEGFSPKYAPPELKASRPPIPETDLYGAGIVLLYALGGDVDTKSFRPDTPSQLVDFCNSLLLHDPRQRPSWERNDPLQAISNIREEVFGRRHLGAPMAKNLKGGTGKRR